MSMTSPLIILVSCAVGMGALATLFIVVAVSVDAWETIYFDQSKLASNVASAEPANKYTLTLASSENNYATLNESQETVVNGTLTTSYVYYYLFETYTGIWRICDILSDSARRDLEAAKQLSIGKCYVFVTEYDEETTDLPDQMRSIGRMQNSAASCFIVSLIDLAAAAAVGAFAIIQKQVSACMVTGVLYCMAGLFSVFGLTIFHTKMYYERYQCYSFDKLTLPDVACDARVVKIGWAIPLNWVGVVVSVIAFSLWIFVTRAFRVIKSKTML